MRWIEGLSAVLTIWNALATGGAAVLAVIVTTLAAAIPQIPAWLLPFLFLGVWLVGAGLLLLAIRRATAHEPPPHDSLPARQPAGGGSGPFSGAQFINSPVTWEVHEAGRIDISASSNTLARTPTYDALVFPPGTLVHAGLAQGVGRAFDATVRIGPGPNPEEPQSPPESKRDR
jgi:hypothetical protein